MLANIITNMQGPTHAGERQLFEVWGNGPASYANGVGDPVTVGPTAFLSAIPGGFLTVSGTYEIKPQPSVSNNLRPTFNFRWFVVSTGAEVGNAVNLSAETVQFFAMGGEM